MLRYIDVLWRKSQKLIGGRIFPGSASNVIGAHFCSSFPTQNLPGVRDSSRRRPRLAAQARPLRFTIHGLRSRLWGSRGWWTRLAGALDSRCTTWNPLYLFCMEDAGYLGFEIPKDIWPLDRSLSTCFSAIVQQSPGNLLVHLCFSKHFEKLHPKTISWAASFACSSKQNDGQGSPCWYHRLGYIIGMIHWVSPIQKMIQCNFTCMKMRMMMPQQPVILPESIVSKLTHGKTPVTSPPTRSMLWSVFVTNHPTASLIWTQQLPS